MSLAKKQPQVPIHRPQLVSKDPLVARSSGQDFVKDLFYFAVILQIIGIAFLKTRIGSGIFAVSFLTNLLLPGIILYRANTWSDGLKYAFYCSFITPIATMGVILLVGIVNVLIGLKKHESINIIISSMFKNIGMSAQTGLLTFIVLFVTGGFAVFALAALARALFKKTK